MWALNPQHWLKDKMGSPAASEGNDRSELTSCWCDAEQPKVRAGTYRGEEGGKDGERKLWAAKQPAELSVSSSSPTIVLLIVMNHKNIDQSKELVRSTEQLVHDLYAVIIMLAASLSSLLIFI